MKVERKIENRQVVAVKPVDTFVLTLERNEADILRAIVGALSLKYDGTIRKVTNKLYDQLSDAGLRGALYDTTKASGNMTVSLIPAFGSTNNPVVRDSNY